MLKNLFKALGALLTLFLIIFTINKSLLFFGIKTGDYIKVSVCLYVTLFIYLFLIFLYKGKNQKNGS